MSYKLGQIPSLRATLAEIADFMECQCLISEGGVYSSVSGKSAMGISYDEDSENDEYEENEDEFPEVYEALAEIEDRNAFSGGCYPFIADVNSVRVREDIDSKVKDVYTFLLLATRENMSSGKIVEGTDGTALFEKLCASVLRNYFGESSKSFVFGTGQENNLAFSSKVQEMLDMLGEGKLAFRVPDNDTNHHKDGKLDVVVFIPFADSRKGQFIAFGQCKTGTNWRSAVSQLDPKVFCDSFCYPSPGFTPIAVFMVTEAFTDNWEFLLRSTNGLLFDRTRIMQYLPSEIEEDLLEQIRKWNAAVMGKYLND